MAIVPDEVAELRALPMPAGDEQTINAIYGFYAKVDDAVKAGRQELDALRAGKTATVKCLDAGAKTVQGQANQAAAAYGPTE